MKRIINKILFVAILVYATYCCVYIYVYMRYPPFSSRNRASLFAAESASFSPATSIGRGNHKRTVQLHETVWGILTPSKFNGTWVSDSDIMYKDEDGGISILNLENNKIIQVKLEISANYSQFYDENNVLYF